MVTWTLTYKLSNVIAHIEETVFVKPKKLEKPQKNNNIVRNAYLWLDNEKTQQVMHSI
jgi:hypothetical protein